MYKYNMGGTVPRETTIGGQRHNLAYINPFEEDLLQQYRQDAPTVPGPGDVPSYYYGQGMTSTAGNKNFQVSKPQKTTGGGQRDEADKQRSREQEAAARADRDAKAQIKAKLASGAYTKNNDGSLVNAGAVAGSASTTGRVNTAAPTVNINKPTAVVATSAGGSANSTADKIAAAKILREAKKRTGLESLANFFTQGSGPDKEGSDFMRYNEFGELVYEIGHENYDPNKPNKLVDPTLKNSFGFKVGMANSNANDASPGRFNQGIGSGFKTDLDMAFAAGFGNPEEQRAKLILAGYSQEEADAYIQKTEATREAGFPDPVDNGNDNPAATVSGIDPFAYTGGGGGTPGKPASDPCPEGFIMDPKTNACVPMDATNSGYQGLPSYIIPDASVPLTDFSRPAVIGQPNLQPYASGTGGNFIQGSNQFDKDGVGKDVRKYLVNQGAPRGYANGGPVGGIMDLLR
jgi:hypothetical protein